MRKFNIMSLLLAVVGVLTFASCQHEYADWTPGEKDSNMGVFFANTENISVSAEDTFVNIEVKRLQTDAAANITLRAEDISSSGFFTVPETLSFAAGAESAVLKVEFDGSKLTPGVQYAIRIKLQESEASAYAVSENTFKIGIPEPWKNLGKAIYRDDFLSPMYGGPAGVMVEIDIVQHELEPNRYRLVEPFSQTMCPEIIGGVPDDMTFTGPGYIEFVVDEAGNVEIPSSPLGFKLVVEEGGSPQDFFLASLEPGVFADGVFWFTKPQSIMWHIPDGRGNYANRSGLFAVALPGYQIKDYAISAAYGGMAVESDNTTTSAVINFAVGADVQSYKFTVLEGNISDTAATIEAIVAGSEDITIYEAAADELTWKLNLPAAGIYTIVAVPYSTEAELEDAISYPFYFHKDGGELPVAQFRVIYDSVANITGNAAYEEAYPGAYFVALALVGNPTEMRSIKAWIGDANVVKASNMTPEQIVMNAGDDFSAAIDMIRAQVNPETGVGSVVLGPYNMASGSTSCAIVAIETLYGDTQVFYVEKELPNATGFTLGEYAISETVDANDYELSIYLTGGYEPGQLIADVEGFQFLGLVDATTNTVVFSGLEVNDGEDYIENEVMFYYNAEKTKVYGYWSASDDQLAVYADLTFSFADTKLSGLETYFASVVFDNTEQGFAFSGYDFLFSPAATVEYVVAEEQPEEQPETTALKASAKSLGAELELGVKADFTVGTIKAEVYNGKVNRSFVNNATIGF